MKRPGRWRRIVMWGGVLACVLASAAWLLATRWQIWYAWQAEILTPLDARLFGIADGGVVYQAFHRHSRGEYLRATPGWHLGSSSGTLGFDKPAIAVRQYRTEAWIPLWLILVTAAIPTLLAWLWPRHRKRGNCDTCAHDLTGNVSGRCPECGKETALRTEERR